MPEQYVRVLVSTASPESMVVLSELGCSTSAFSVTPVPTDCAVSRGVLFQSNKSSTWNEAGTYGINGNGVGLEYNLGYSVNAKFALGESRHRSQRSRPQESDRRRYCRRGTILFVWLSSLSGFWHVKTPVLIIPNFHISRGIFGLNNQPVNFSSLGNYSAPSFLTTLKDQGSIPSLSWSYTAGAQYRKCSAVSGS